MGERWVMPVRLMPFFADKTYDEKIRWLISPASLPCLYLISQPNNSWFYVSFTRLPTCLSYEWYFFSPKWWWICSRFECALDLLLVVCLVYTLRTLEKTSTQCKQSSYFIKVSKYHRVPVRIRIKLQRKQESAVWRTCWMSDGRDTAARVTQC